MKSQQSGGLGLWLRLVLSIFVPPLIILLLGNYFVVELKRDARIKDFETRAEERLENLALASRTQRYISERLNEIFGQAKNKDDLKLRVKEFLTASKLKADFLIWQRGGKVFFSNFKLKQKPGNWKKAYQDLLQFARGEFSSEAKIPTKTYYNLRRLFGPHFFPRYFSRCYGGREPRLLMNDCSMNAPPQWIKVAKKFGLAVFFDPEVLEKYPGIEADLAQADSSGLEAAVLTGGKILSGNRDLEVALNQAADKLQYNFNASLDLGEYMVSSHYIHEDLVAICAIRKKALFAGLMSREQVGGMVLSVLVALLLMLKSYLVVVKRQSFSLLLKKQLLLLFLLSNLLPGYVIAVIGYDYLQQYHQALLNQAYARSMSYLQDIDELYESELTFQKGRVEKALQKLSENLAKKGVSAEDIQDFIKPQTPQPFRMFLVGSHTAEVVTNEAILKNGKLIKLLDQDFLRGPHKKQQADAMHKIGKFFLALLNRETIPTKMGTEVEMLSETLSQKEPVEMMQEFLQRDGGFWQWGIGNMYRPAYIQILQLFDKKLYDYLFVYLWSDYELQRHFMSRLFSRFSRNEHNIRVMAINDAGNLAMPKELKKNRELNDFVDRLQEKSTRKLDYCIWEDQKYLIVGLKCNKLSHFRLLGLFPVERLEKLVKDKRELLLGFGILSLLIALSLGMFIASSLIEPLGELQKGIGALNERNFSYRLPDLGNDEFGHLAEIFNSTLVDLEEMHTASSFKHKIISNDAQVWKTKSFEIFGQTLAFSDSGSDYLEIFADENDSPPRIILGDVAESGVAAILILAFIKSALMQLEELYHEPAKLVSELERLLMISSREGQGRCVAFQYLLVDDAAATVEMVNAGLFFPLMLDCKTGSINEIEMPGSPLGTGTGATRLTRRVDIGADQALILFSNGILAEGKISREQIMALFSDIDRSGAEAIFNSFVARFKSRFASVPEDDITMVVIRYNKLP